MSSWSDQPLLAASLDSRQDSDKLILICAYSNVEHMNLLRNSIQGESAFDFRRTIRNWYMNVTPWDRRKEWDAEGSLAWIPSFGGLKASEVCIILCPYAPLYNVMISLDLRSFPLPRLAPKGLKRGVPIESEPIPYQPARLSFFLSVHPHHGPDSLRSSTR